jgi:hypothetical protein
VAEINALAAYMPATPLQKTIDALYPFHDDPIAWMRYGFDFADSSLLDWNKAPFMDLPISQPDWLQRLGVMTNPYFENDIARFLTDVLPPDLQRYQNSMGSSLRRVS